MSCPPSRAYARHGCTPRASARVTSSLLMCWNRSAAENDAPPAESQGSVTKRLDDLMTAPKEVNWARCTMHGTDASGCFYELTRRRAGTSLQSAGTHAPGGLRADAPPS